MPPADATRARRLGRYLLERPLSPPSATPVWVARRTGPLGPLALLGLLARLGLHARPGPLGRFARPDRRGDLGDLGADPSMAIKWCARSDGAAMVSLQREAAALQASRHRHVVALVEVVCTPRRLGLVLPLAVHGTLDDRLRAGPLDASTTIALGVALADGLAAVHAAGLVHGDVKPSNVLFVERDVPVLADFGLAGPAGSPSVDGLVSGTAEYLDPDLVDGAPRSEASDVYALGVLLYTSLRGEVPYRGATALATARLADAGDADPLGDLTGVPPALAAIVHRAMARDRGERFAHASDVGDALARLASPALAPAARPPTDSGTRVFGPRPPLPAERHATRHRRLPAVALAAAAVVAAGIGLANRAAGRAAPCPSPHVGRATGAVVIDADLDGDACVDALRWAPPVLTVVHAGGAEPVRTFSLDASVSGTDGIVVFAGDWWCRGTDLLGWYEPATGNVRLFTSWGTGRLGDALPPPVVHNGRARQRPVVRRGGGPGTCDTVAFDR